VRDDLGAAARPVMLSDIDVSGEDDGEAQTKVRLPNTSARCRPASYRAISEPCRLQMRGLSVVPSVHARRAFPKFESYQAALSSLWVQVWTTGS
jgi:hypothetical protein